MQGADEQPYTERNARPPRPSITPAIFLGDSTGQPGFQGAAYALALVCATMEKGPGCRVFPFSSLISNFFLIPHPKKAESGKGPRGSAG